MRMLNARHVFEPSQPRLEEAEHAVQGHIDSLGPGSKRTVAQSLDRVAIALAGDEKAHRLQIHWHQLDRVVIEKAREVLANTYEPATVNKMLSCVRGVLRSCLKLGQMSQQEFDAVMGFANVPLVNHSNPEQLQLVSDDEIEAMLEVCHKGNSPAGRRDAALLAILLSSGIRRMEAVELQTDDYSITSHSLRIRSAVQGRDRVLVLKPAARFLIEAWLDVRASQPGPLLLPVNKSGMVVHRKLTDQAIHDIIRRLAVRAGVPHITTRALRRTVVASLIVHGLPLERVQEIVGHASWVTTEAYSQLASELAASLAARGAKPLSQFMPVRAIPIKKGT